MRAVLCRKYGPPESLTIEDVDDPTAADGQVVVDVKACAVNFPDVLIIQNLYQFKPPLPFSPGAEVAGVVSSVGPGVDGVTVGDRVFASPGWGALAEKIALGASSLIPIPDGIDFGPASSFLYAYGTSHYALKDRARLQAGEIRRAGRRRRCRPRRGRVGRTHGRGGHRGCLQRREARALP